MTGELVDVIDDNGLVIDTMSREETEKLNHTIQNVLVFIFNSLGKVWVQKRPMHKKHFPGLWDISACGAVASGEEPAKAAERETQEEMGIDAELTFVETFINVFPGHHNQTFRRLSHLYIGISDETPKENDEVDEFRILSPAQLEKDVKQKPDEYIPAFMLELEKATAAFKKLQ